MDLVNSSPQIQKPLICSDCGRRIKQPRISCPHCKSTEDSKLLKGQRRGWLYAVVLLIPYFLLRLFDDSRALWDPNSLSVHALVATTFIGPCLVFFVEMYSLARRRFSAIVSSVVSVFLGIVAGGMNASLFLYTYLIMMAGRIG